MGLTWRTVTGHRLPSKSHNVVIPLFFAISPVLLTYGVHFASLEDDDEEDSAWLEDSGTASVAVAKYRCVQEVGILDPASDLSNDDIVSVTCGVVLKQSLIDQVAQREVEQDCNRVTLIDSAFRVSLGSRNNRPTSRAYVGDGGDYSSDHIDVGQ